MERRIELNGKTIKYVLTYKKVKNINLRVKSNGEVHISASRFIPISVIEDFLASKSNFIINALDKIEFELKNPPKKYFDEGEIRKIILELCDKNYPYFQYRGIKYPEIKFRKMVSRWGSCNPKKGIVTFNINLMYAPIECIEYVVLHEFTHFLQANHSQEFYYELEKTCPDWKNRRKKLKEINIR